MRRMALERGAWGPERLGKGTAPAEGHSAPSRPRLTCYRHALHHARRVSCERQPPRLWRRLPHLQHVGRVKELHELHGLLAGVAAAAHDCQALVLQAKLRCLDPLLFALVGRPLPQPGALLLDSPIARANKAL
jgi:hypothetical protein